MDKNCQDCGQEPLRYNNRSGFCKKCYEKNRARNKIGTVEWDERRADYKSYYDETRIKRVHYQRTRKYGLSLERYYQMLREQNYACAICERRIDELNETLNVDHDHSCCPTDRNNPKTCGKCVRMLLCTDCNQGLGRFKDDLNLMEKAMNYLRDYKPVPESDVLSLLKG